MSSTFIFAATLLATPLIIKKFAYTYKEVISNAKLSGKILAIALAFCLIFPHQSVSIVGFSMGCQVAKSCLSMLNKLGANDIIQNVTFLGGATHF